MPADLPNLWAKRDLPILVEVARLLEVDRVRHVVPKQVAEITGLNEDDVARSFVVLKGRGYVEGITYQNASSEVVYPTEMTERGHREVGMWPSSSDGRALIEVIEQAAAQETDDDKRGALRELLRSARNVSEGTLGSIAATVVTRLTLGA